MKVLIVDDEPPARRGLRWELEQLPGISVVGECQGRDDAIAAIVERRPDLVLLDVQLGRATAFDIIEEIGVDRMPLVVFVTAFDRHAVKAFQVHALDYVLKPVDPDRLREALERAASLLSLRRDGSLAERMEQFLTHRPAAPRAAAPPPLPRLVVRDGDRLALVEAERVEWIESAANYVRVHAADRTGLVRSTMDGIARRLAPFGLFIRVRRTALVNIRAVLTLERYAKGMFVVHLKSGARIISSRYYQQDLRQLLRP